MRTFLQSPHVFLALLAMPLALPASAEKVLGAYIFARHGDRTAKVLKNTQLTDLGYSEVFSTGSYYRSRYIDSDSTLQVQGISEDIVKLSQISASTPSDTVLQNSATGFLQGVYPPVGASANETLADGTIVDSPMDGYQLIPLTMTDSGSNSEDTTWLQSATNCQNAEISSNNYYTSSLYNSLLSSTKDFYQSFSSMLNSSFSESAMNFKNAYTIFDYLNVGYIHNTTNVPTEDQLHQLLLLANIEQYNLAYNSSETVRAIAGAKLAGDVLQGLNKTVISKGKTKLNFQFGSYGTFLSYFGLAQLPAADVNFTGIPDYASSMAWELVTNSSGDFPPTSEISVRFVFHNGTINESMSDGPTVYPLYGQSSLTIPWSDFVHRTEKIAVTSTSQWCQVCGNTNGQCASYSNSSDSGSTTQTKSTNGMSRPVAGVIGAMVTLAVILGVEALFLVVGGFRVIKKRGTTEDAATDEEDKTE
ncbi:phosphoglycerate mutase-like protein [Aspergillus sclerotioniger CBS 115572]|uniref:Phosphoglycerate mutase-like protein n=1 Tax=Aspergillus sclerotioniger CBS 115572 TaxID=1450535 RepID=A0A317WPU2_9EURO|nr:phosphoglycerate mutase-like protein [Aspergillus sclerotioniger CBS 115572]PWY88055.1 phosphoglycerate mutase-like protein [Aspergillus sclerotioniger CBS 115572]